MPSDVVVTSRSFGTGAADPAAMLREAGHEMRTADPGHDPALLAEPLAGAAGWIAGAAPIGPEHMDLAPGLRVIARYGTGIDAVDLGAAAERGVVVTRTPGANAESVADHAVALMLAVLRGVVAGDRAARAGDWGATARGRELGALTVGVVGFGAVGRAVARRVHHGFGSPVLAHDPYAPVREPARPAGLEELVGQADIVSLHLPGGDEPLVGDALLARFKPGAVLVNTARGTLLDEAAVARALEAGTLAGAGLDVLAAEPATASPLLTAPNVTLTPHTAAQTTQAVDRMGLESAGEVLRVLGGEPALHAVEARR